MPFFFFHLRDHTDQALDPDGINLPSLEDAKAKALEAARDTVSHDVKAGLIDLSYRIDVEDSEGNLLHSLPLADSFTIIN